MNEDKLKTFWFQKEEKGVSNIIKGYGSDELKQVYKFFSKSVHASHIGMFLLKDDPDNIDIYPCENPMKTNLAIVLSCKFLLELINIRIIYESLGFESEYTRFIERILALESEVRG